MNYCQSFCRTIKQMCNSGAIPLLPSEYQQVEYIWGNSCYINPGFTNQTPIEFECEAKSYSGSGYVLGAFRPNNRFFVQLYSSSGKTALGYAGAYKLGGTVSRNVYHKLSGMLHNGQQTLYVDDVLDIDATMTGTPSELPIYIFGANTEGGDRFTGEMKYFKLWSNGTLIFDGIPCYRKADNRAGFYDTVSGQLFDNAESGNFGVGPNV